MKQFREEFSRLSRRGMVQILILIVGIIASIAFASTATATTYTTREQIPEQHQSDVAFLHGTDYDLVHVENGTREMTTLAYHYMYEDADGSYTITHSLGKNMSNIIIFLAIVALLVTVYQFVQLNNEFDRYQFQLREQRAKRKNTSE